MNDMTEEALKEMYDIAEEIEQTKKGKNYKLQTELEDSAKIQKWQAWEVWQHWQQKSRMIIELSTVRAGRDIKQLYQNANYNRR